MLINKKLNIQMNYVFTINTIGYHNILNGTASIIASKLRLVLKTKLLIKL